MSRLLLRPRRNVQRLIVFIFLLAQSQVAWSYEISGLVGIESLGFIHNPIEGQQHNHYFSGVFETQFYHEWNDGRQALAFVPFLRVSQHDDRRTHFDIRELNWLKVADSWELRIGIRKEFWGVAEAQHLVDIINQTDLVENNDTEDKLGQPMINLALIDPDWGTLDLYFLTGFRERTFAGPEGRLRTTPYVDVGNARFEKHGAEKHLGFAVRWSQAVGDWDLGLSHFYGTSREPTLLPELDGSGQLELIPYYEMIHQTGVDMQLTRGSWLWKLESIVRSGQGNTFFAGTGGLEYTFFDLYQTGLDLGIVMEYLYDSRGGHAPVLFQDDILTGLRFSFNDIQSTQILAGVIFDRTNNAKFFNVEASRRFGESFKAELELRTFNSIPKNDPAYLIRHDDHVRFELSYHF